MEKHDSAPNTLIGLKFILRAFHYRNYRLFFTGQSVSLIGTWMQMIAISWLVYRLTKSPLLLGVVSFTTQIPILLFSPLTGVFADHIDRRKILLVTQSLAMLQAFVLAFLTLANIVTVWHVMAMSLFLGIIDSFEFPARHAFISEMIERKEDFSNAIALNSTMFNAARLIGPSIAGVLIAYLGEGVCFLFNGVSFLALIIALLAMKIAPRQKAARRQSYLHNLKEGFLYAFGFVQIRYILLFVTLVGVVGMAYTILMPVIAKETLKGGPKTLGLLMASSGLGALLGTFYLARRRNAKGLGRVITASMFFFGATLVAFSFSRWLWLSVFLIFCLGFGLIVELAASNTILQTLTDDDKRGRVMSLFIAAFLGMAPFGSLLAGYAASRIGSAATILASGILCIAGAFLFLKKQHIYEEYI